MDEIQVSHWRIGDMLLSALSDGYFEMKPHHLLVGLPSIVDGDRRAETALPSKLRIPVRAYLIRTPGYPPALIDCGFGSGAVPTLGRLASAVQKLGIALDDIGHVLVTHLHADHCGGLIDDSGGPRFPHAIVVVHPAELAFWTDDRDAGRSPHDQKMCAFVRKRLAPYQGRIHSTDSETLFKGVNAVHNPGHTPGHTGFRLGDGEETALIWGDLITAGQFQLEDPCIGIVGDVDRLAAMQMRWTLLRETARTHEMVGGAHMASPGLGYIKAEAKGFSFVPKSSD